MSSRAIRGRRAAIAGFVACALALAVLPWNGEAIGASQPGGPGGVGQSKGVISPVLEGLLANLSRDQPVSVTVVLRDQVDAAAISGRDRGERLRNLVVALRAKAEATQHRLRAVLRRGLRDGSVISFTPLWILNSIGVVATPPAIQELAGLRDVVEIVPDRLFGAPSLASLPAEPNVAVVRAPELWALGDRGQGVVVASMDTGVDYTHPDLSASWRGGTNSWYDPNGQHPSAPTDVSGHGTQTMGTIVGGDAGGTSIGVAPGARWIAAKIFNDGGTATSTVIHLGYQWLLDPDGNPATTDAPNIVNNSWTFGSPGCNLEFQPDLQALVAAGITPVFAAGNFGPSSSTSASPANYPEALSVGATNNADGIYSLSARGPTTCGGGTRTFPTVTAPGVSVRTSDLYQSWIYASGTSMAATHVSGALALLVSAHPGLTVDQQKSALIGTAIDLGTLGLDNTFGAGRIDVRRAYDSLSGPAPTPTPTPAPTPTPTPAPTPTPTPAPTPTPTPAPTPTPLGDLVGPPTTDAVVAPNPANGSVAVSMSALIDDSSTGGSAVTAGEYFIDATGTSGSGQPLSGQFGSVTVTASGTISTTALAGLSSGNHTIYVHGRDSAANWGPYRTTILIIDRSAPTMSSLTATPNPTRGAATISLAGLATDPSTPGPATTISGAEWFEGQDPGGGNGSAMTPTDGSFDSSSESVSTSITVTNLASGEHVLWVRARDLGGNWGAASPAAVTVAPNDLVFADGFESGGLGSWSSATGVARLSVSAGAAMRGRYGLGVTLSGKNTAYVSDNSPAAEISYHARFYLNPRTWVTSGREIGLLVGVTSSSSIAFQVQYQRTTGGSSQIRATVVRRGGQTTTAWFAMTDAAHAVELGWQSATNAVVTLTIDGAVVQTLTGIDTSTYRIETVRLGPSTGLANGMNGNGYIDGFVSTRTSAIGP